MPEENRRCLRCKEVPLEELRSESDEIRFFRCSTCCREYALRPGKSLTFRWLHPISIPLYAILFEPDPMSLLARMRPAGEGPFPSPEQVMRDIAEIELELDHPTQNVRDILDNPQSEEQCRDYLRKYVDEVHRTQKLK